MRKAGIHGPPGPGTDRSEPVRDFRNFVGPGPVPGFEIFLKPLGSGPTGFGPTGPWIPGGKISAGQVPFICLIDGQNTILCTKTNSLVVDFG